MLTMNRFDGTFLMQKRFLATLSATLLISVVAHAQQSESPTSEKSAALFKDIFEIPAEAETFEDLLKFVQEIDSIEVDAQSKQETQAHQRKVARTVVMVAEKVLATDPQDRELAQGLSLKLQGLAILEALGEPNADSYLREAIQNSTGAEHPLVRAIGMKFFVESGFSRWAAWDESKQEAWIQKISDYLQASDADAGHIQMLLAIVDFLSDVNGEKYALQLLDKLIPHYQQNENPGLAPIVSRMQGIARRLNLPGNKMKLDGMLLDGSEFDWSKYRGKVVLVDFWATWCGPCRAEVPNLLKQYADYHEKGFDILGISLDDTKQQAESYIQKMDIPWATLFSQNEDERGWEHPMAVRYGISGIPRAILVDRDGTVVHMNARGGILAKELRRLLGEPVAKRHTHQDSLLQQVSMPHVSR